MTPRRRTSFVVPGRYPIRRGTGHRLAAFVKRRKGTALVALLLLAVVAVCAGGLAVVAGRPGPYATSIDLSFSAMMQNVALQSNATARDLAENVSKAPSLQRVAFMQGLQSDLTEAAAEAAAANSLGPPWPPGEIGKTCIAALTDRRSAVSLVQGAFSAVLGGPTGQSTEPVTSVLSRLNEAVMLVTASDHMWNRCASKLRRAPGRARLPVSGWVDAEGPGLSPPPGPRQHPTTKRLPSTTTSPPPTTTTSTPSSTTTSTTTPPPTTTSTTPPPAPAPSTTTSPSPTTTTSTPSPTTTPLTGTAALAAYATPSTPSTPSTTNPSPPPVPRIWTEAYLDGAIAAAAVSTGLAARPGAGITSYDITPAPLPSSSPGAFILIPTSRIALTLVVADTGNTEIRSLVAAVQMVGGTGPVHAAGRDMAIKRADPVVRLEPGQSVALSFKAFAVTVPRSYTLSVSVATSTPPASASVSFTVADG